MASRLPVRAASISGVSPSGPSSLGSAPACNSFSIIGALPCTRSQIQRRGAFAIGQLDIGPGGDQQVGHLEIVAIGGPLNRRRAVGLRGVHDRLSVATSACTAARSPFMAASAIRAAGAKSAQTQRQRSDRN